MWIVETLFRKVGHTICSASNGHTDAGSMGAAQLYRQAVENTARLRHSILHPSQREMDVPASHCEVTMRLKFIPLSLAQRLAHSACTKNASLGHSCYYK